MIYYGKHTVDGSYGFHTKEMYEKGTVIDPVEITDDYYKYLLEMQNKGDEIIPNPANGYPVLRGH